MTNYIGITSASYCHSWAIMGISSIFRILKKSRYYRLLKFLKKSKLPKSAPCRCCVYFVHPDSTSMKKQKEQIIPSRLSVGPLQPCESFSFFVVSALSSLGPRAGCLGYFAVLFLVPFSFIFVLEFSWGFSP